MTPSERAIIEAWKRAGGIYKEAASEVEKELEAEEAQHAAKPV